MQIFFSNEDGTPGYNEVTHDLEVGDMAKLRHRVAVDTANRPKVKVIALGNSAGGQKIINPNILISLSDGHLEIDEILQLLEEELPTAH